MIEKRIFKLVIAGSAAIGKTAFVNRFITNKFSSKVSMTIGVDIFVQYMDLKKLGQLKLQIWDLSGENRFRFMLPDFIKGADGIILMFSLHYPTSITEINEWIEFLRKYNSAAPIILVGTESDLVNSDERKNLSSKGKEIATENHFQDYFEACSKTGENVDEAFGRIIELMWNKSSNLENIEEIKDATQQIVNSGKNNLNMVIARESIKANGYKIPCISIIPPNPKGAAVIIHGYGGCKEELLGLAWKVAEAGLAAYTIDLHGHGEHSLPLSDGVIRDVEFSLEFCRKHGKILAIGHSLGGRLALLCQADYAIAISPALNKEFSKQTHDILKDMRSYRVNEESPDSIFKIVKELPTYQYNENRPTKIIFGSRDVPEVARDCLELKENGAIVKEIDNGLHSDTFNLQPTFKEVIKSIKIWFN